MIKSSKIQLLGGIIQKCGGIIQKIGGIKVKTGRIIHQSGGIPKNIVYVRRFSTKRKASFFYSS